MGLDGALIRRTDNILAKRKRTKAVGRQNATQKIKIEQYKCH
jgi:hypothetical protein